MNGTFIGHRDCCGLDEQRVERAIYLMIKMGVKSFYCGGMGNFDLMCAKRVYEFKKRFSDIKSFLVIPYLSFRIGQEKFYDEVIYPEGFENYFFKAAITERNNYLVDKSDVCLCFITHKWGGAAKTFEKAVKKNKIIINLGNKNL